MVRGTKSILHQEQLDRFKAAVKQDWVWRDFFLTELTAGLRRGELCGLKWSDFDETAGTLNVCRTIHARKGGGVEPPPKPEHQKSPKTTDFQAVKGKYRKPGTGCITKINDHLWEGRYSPKVNGKRIARNVYAPTEEECEQKLAELIKEMKKELEPLRAKGKAC